MIERSPEAKSSQSQSKRSASRRKWRRRCARGQLGVESLEARLPLHASIVISEVMYQAPAPTVSELADLTDATAADFEFVELRNPSFAEAISVGGMQLEGDISFLAGDYTLQPGETALIVSNEAAFRVRYGDSPVVLGEWSGTLADQDTSLTLKDDDGHEIVELQMNTSDLWPMRAAGMGASLELLDPVDTLPAQMSKPSKWASSVTFGGTPGAARETSLGVVINEVLAGEDPATLVVDQIELLNTSDAAIDLSGWLLSDSSDALLKYAIEPGTVIDPGEYLVFNGTQFHPAVEAPEEGGFRLDQALGGTLFLTVADGDGGVSRFADSVAFESQQDGRSWGRRGNHERLAPLQEPTLGDVNAGFDFGPLVVTELAYNPGPPSPAALQIDPELDQESLEYLEFYNPTPETVDVSGWRIAGVTQFEFPDETVVAPGETLLVLSFPAELEAFSARTAAFRAHYGTDSIVRMLGPYIDPLPDDDGIVQWYAPGEPLADAPDVQPLIHRGAIQYDDLPPWPGDADGLGMALTRVDTELDGRDASSWESRLPSPGEVDFTPPAQALLPDLAVWDDPIFGFNYLEYFDTHQETGHRLMRFATAVMNQGVGPLIVEGRNPNGNVQDVFQIVEKDDGTTTEYAAGEFVYHPEHGHVHFADYTQYKLYAVTEDDQVGELVAGGDKVSFCLVDFAPFNMQLDGAPTFPRFVECERSTQGISVGWSDIYTANLYDQWIDIENVPDGEYWLETVVDPHNNLVESNETNNSVRHKVVLGAPNHPKDAIDAQGLSERRLGTGDKRLENLSLHDAADIDTFRWVAPDDGTLDVQLNFDRQLGDADLYVWSSSPTGERDLLMSVTDGSGERVTTTAIAGRTYFMVVKDLSGQTHPNYELVIDGPDIPADQFEPNNTLLSATVLGDGDHQLTGLNIHEPEERDFFVWTAAESGTLLVDLRFSTAQGNLDLYVHDFLSHEIASSVTNAAREAVELEVEAGRQYLMIVSGRADDMVASYSLLVDFLDTPLDAYEPNDRLETAADLGGGTVEISDVNIHRPFNADFYRWTAAEASQVIVDLNYDLDEGNLDLYLWQNGESVSSSRSNTNADQLVFSANANEPFVLEVRGRDGATSSQYSLRFDPVVIDVDEFEPNDQLEAATVLVGDDIHLTGLSIHDVDDQDFFSWTADQDGQVAINVNFRSIVGNLQLVTWEDGTELQHIEGPGDQRVVQWQVETGDIIFFDVRGVEGETNRYSLDLVFNSLPPDEFEPNEQREMATMLVGDDVVIDRLTLHDDQDRDVYRWTPTSTGQAHVEVLFSHALADLQLVVYQGDDDPVVIDSENDNERADIELAVGQAIEFEVRSALGTPARYSLKLTLESTPPDVFEPNDSVDEASELTGDDILLNDLSLHDANDTDFFSWAAESNGTSTVELIFDHATADLELAIWDADQVIDLIDSSDDGESFTTDVMAGRNYLIQVRGKPDLQYATYTLRWTFAAYEGDAFEPNNSLATASVLAHESKTYSGLSVHEPNDKDFYRWSPNVSGPAAIDLLFAQSDGDLDLILWDGESEVARSDGSDDNEQLQFDAVAGTEYTFEVRGKDGAVNPAYQLDLHEANAARVDSVRVGKSTAATTLMELIVSDGVTRLIPWLDLTTIELTFSRNVIINQDDLLVEGTLHGGYEIMDFTYDQQRHAATWTLVGMSVAEQITLSLSETVADEFGNLIDGEAGPVTLPSGDGLPGGAFSLQFDVRPGDFTGDGVVDDLDINRLALGIREQDSLFDFNADGTLDESDILTLVSDVMGTAVGDSNLDGRFNSADMVLIFQGGEYEDDLAGNSEWLTGDWNGDGEFSSSDLIFAFQQGSYER